MSSAVFAAEHQRVLREGRPLIDLRAPAEFARGAFPNAVNLPLLDDAERAAVGTCFKAHGQDAAIALGGALVSGARREARIMDWQAHITRHPDALLYCWRGGLRSQTAQAWLAERGCHVPRIDGGYKALRHVCMEAIAAFSCTKPLLVLGGRTGSGKTLLLQEFAAALDLEKLANHRGSAFGAAITPQPTPIEFENSLAIAMMNLANCRTVLVEDESRTIGRLGLPDALHAAMQQAPLIVLEVPRAQRARHIFDEYISLARRDGLSDAALLQRFTGATDRIQRRLGGVRHAQIRTAIGAAFATANHAMDAHLAWIEQLLEWYYDPMYDHQLTAKQGRIVKRGDRAAIRSYLYEKLQAQALLNPA
jgi:tRNA 2-selenouridine synthase